MQLLISDANILIDMEEGDLISLFFNLPFEFCVPDILFYEELEEQHSHLLEMGLALKELSPASLLQARDAMERYSGPSRNDIFALLLAKQERCPLLSGDGDLRIAAEAEKIKVRGTLWVVEELVQKRIIGIEQALQAYEKMKSAGRRLPWTLARKRLNEL